MKTYSVSILMLLLSTQMSCTSHKNVKIKDENSSIQVIDKEIKLWTKTFFKSYYFKNYLLVDTLLLSKDLNQLFDQIALLEKSSAQKITQSANPTDKPFVMEGDCFSSVYEGGTDYKLLSHITKEKSYLLPVQFSNSTYKLQWVDTFVLLKEDNQLKLDNVLYNHKNEMSYPNLKIYLNELSVMPNG